MNQLVTAPSQMSTCAVQAREFDECHELHVLSGGKYPFVSICKNGEEVYVIEISPGYRVYHYTIVPVFHAAGVDISAQIIEIVTHFNGKYDYVEILKDEETLLLHEVA